MFNAENEAHILTLELTNGHVYKDYYIDNAASALEKFIAVRPGAAVEGEPLTVEFIKIDNIARLEIDEKDVDKVISALYYY